MYDHPTDAPLDIAVIGSGISGLAAAWLLSRRHTVTLVEKEDRLGGHSNTAIIGSGSDAVAADTGFLVYNEPAYPNLTALFDCLGVETIPTEMSFAASLDGGRFEYSGSGLTGLLAQPTSAMRPRWWLMIRGIRRFYREAPALLRSGDDRLTLGEYLARERYSRTFIEDHLLPMAAAIWSSPPGDVLSYPAAAFVRFFVNHGLLKLTGRPPWRTVVGGSHRYVERMAASLQGRIRLNTAIRRIRRGAEGVTVEDRHGERRRFDHVVIAAHADQAFAMLTDADESERDLLNAFRYQRNVAILHSDPTLMPRRRAAWSSWNYIAAAGHDREAPLTVTYWINRLQRLPERPPLFVTLNPSPMPAEGLVHRSYLYDHPIVTPESLVAQKRLWSLQGRRRTWFCGAYFGAGFHEDGLQAGLAVAEALGGVRRPWTVAGESDRIVLPCREPVGAVLP